MILGVSDTYGDYIFNGESAEIEEAPWIVNIDKSCTGVIISDRAILTAAHCLDEKDDYEKLKVGTEKYNYNKKSLTFEVKKGITHPLFNPDKTDHLADLGIIITAKPLEFSDNVQPICVPAKNLSVNFDEGVKIYGFGTVTDFITEWKKYHGENVKQPETVLSAAFTDLLDKMEKGEGTAIEETETKAKLKTIFNNLFPGIGDLEKVIKNGKITSKVKSKIRENLLKPVPKNDEDYETAKSALEQGLNRFVEIINDFEPEEDSEGSKIAKFWQIMEILLDSDEGPLFEETGADDLQKGIYTLTPQSDCQSLDSSLESSVVCLKSTSSICSGDSGGPAVVIRHRRI